jgi:hypothetical protein
MSNCDLRYFVIFGRLGPKSGTECAEWLVNPDPCCDKRPYQPRQKTQNRQEILA